MTSEIGDVDEMQPNRYDWKVAWLIIDWHCINGGSQHEWMTALLTIKESSAKLMMID